MTLRVTLCDDSGMARKQLLRALPQDWDAQMHMAEHGEQALERVRAGQAEVLFLDLNMPVKDGYQTLEAIQAEQLECLVIVVSGDIQPQARQRVLALGAMAFVKKPMAAGEVRELLQAFGLYQVASGKLQLVEQNKPALSAADKRLDVYREVANVAMGQAGEKLARMLDTFIDLPVPNVNFIAPSELHMAIQAIDTEQAISAVSQGFYGAGITGEAMVFFTDTSVAGLCDLLGQELSGSPRQQEIEALMDVASLLTSSCMQGLAQQVHIDFAQVQPILVGQDQSINDIVQANQQRWQNVLAIEIGYRLQQPAITFELLILFPEHALPILDRHLAHWLEERAEDSHD
ncbi:response regulator [Idiomarina tyrosinivorans]|uniref:Response regulator n=1 Tax=Idiomarina tyrosinivorans TaxID=1445662 RepID=A0A432ZR27_9GAMM|nr:response regulator [Idiomarina tyrosinivorans]RUO80333.1 response regulator [Idiomarina tyrosinivorans]